MNIHNEPIQIDEGDHQYFVAATTQPYVELEIYALDGGRCGAALTTEIVLRELWPSTLTDYVPTNLRWRKDRKAMTAAAMTEVRRSILAHFPEVLFFPRRGNDSAYASFAIELPTDLPIIPGEVEQKLLHETRVTEFHQQLRDSESPLRVQFERSLDHAVRAIAYGR